MRIDELTRMNLHEIKILIDKLELTVVEYESICVINKIPIHMVFNKNRNGNLLVRFLKGLKDHDIITFDQLIDVINNPARGWNEISKYRNVGKSTVEHFREEYEKLWR